MMNRSIVSWSIGIVAGMGIGGSVLMAQQIQVGDIDNIVQTIRSVVITEDGQPSDSDRSNVIMWMNDPIGDPDNEVRLRPGAFADRTIAYEDIDRSTFSLNGATFCDPTQALVALSDTDGDGQLDPVCTTPQGGYRSPVSAASSASGGPIYYAGRVGIGPVDSTPDSIADGVNEIVADTTAADLSLVGDVQIDGNIRVGSSTNGIRVYAAADAAIIDQDGDLSIGVGTDGVRSVSTPVAIGSASIPRVGDVPTGDPIVHLAVGYESMSPSGTTVAHDDRLTVMNAYGTLRMDTSIAGYAVLGTTRPLYIGGADMSNHYLAGTPGWSLWSPAYAATMPPDRSTQVVVGSNTTPLDYDGGALTPTDTAGLVVDGVASFRGVGARGGLQFQQMANASITYQLSGTTTDGAQLGCSVLSVDDQGNVILREVPGCGAGWESPVINGQCGGAHNNTYTSTPSVSTLCAQGSVQWTDTGAADGTWNWSCIGYGTSATTVSCQATKQPDTYSWVCNESTTTPACIGTYTTTTTTTTPGQCVFDWLTEGCDDGGGGTRGNCQTFSERETISINTLAECLTYIETACGSFPDTSFNDGSTAFCDKETITSSTYEYEEFDFVSFTSGESDTTTTTNSCSGISQSLCGSGQYNTCSWQSGTSQNVVCESDQTDQIVDDNLCPAPEPSVTSLCNTLVTPTTYCGSAAGVASSTQPTTNLCVSSYTAVDMTSNGIVWEWVCYESGQDQLTVPNYYCAAPQTSSPVNGICGAAAGTGPLSSPPSVALCDVGTSGSVTLTSNGLYKRQCIGSNGGTNAVCSATSTTYNLDPVSGSNDGWWFVCGTDGNWKLGPSSSSTTSAGSANASNMNCGPGATAPINYDAGAGGYDFYYPSMRCWNAIPSNCSCFSSGQTDGDC